MNPVIKEINFLPQRIILSQEKKKKRLILIIVSIVLATIFGLLVLIPFRMENFYLEKDRELERELSALNVDSPIYNQMVAKQKEYNNKKKVLEVLKKGNFKVLPFLENVSNVLPAGAYISNLSIIADEGVKITFISPDPVATASIVVGLRKLDVFQAVEIEEVPFIDEGSKPIQMDLRFKWAKEQSGESAKKESMQETGKGDLNEAVKNLQDIKNKLNSQ